MYYNTSISACHTFIPCSQLDCTSVWPEWWNQCRNAHKLQQSWIKGSAQWNNHFFTWRLLQKRHHTRAWSQTGLALLCSWCVKSPKEGIQRELFSHLNQNMSFWKASVKGGFPLLTNWSKVPTGSWLYVPWAKYLWIVIWTAQYVCKGMFAETKEKEEIGQYFVGILLYSDSARGDL